MNNLVLEEVDNLVNYIKNSNNYKKYLELRDIIKNNKEIMESINNVKRLQKKAVNESHKGKDISEIDKEIKSILDRLNGYPIYNEFTYLQDDLNELFQGIKNILENYVNSKTN